MQTNRGKKTGKAWFGGRSSSRTCQPSQQPCQEGSPTYTALVSGLGGGGVRSWGPGWPRHTDGRTPTGLTAVAKGGECFPLLRSPPPHPHAGSLHTQRSVPALHACSVMTGAPWSTRTAGPGRRLAGSVPTATSVCLPPRFPRSSLHHGLVSLLS